MIRPLLLGFFSVLIPMFPATSAEPGDGISDLEAKLHGEWKGLGPCDGVLTLKPDGTFDWKHYGPAGDHLRGKWEIQWKALPPTMVFHEENPPDDVERTKTRYVQRLNDDSLVLQYFSTKRESDANPVRFVREKNPQ